MGPSKRKDRPPDSTLETTGGEGSPPAPLPEEVLEPRPQSGLEVALESTEEESGTAALIFEVAGQRYGLPVRNVIQIVEMVAITALPGAPAVVVGVVNFRGRVIPVLDVRRRLRSPAQPWTLRTPIVVVRIGDRVAGLVVDSVSGVIEIGEEKIAEPGQIFTRETAPSHPLITGVARLEDGLLLIIDLAAFFSPEEEKGLVRALDQ